VIFLLLSGAECRYVVGGYLLGGCVWDEADAGSCEDFEAEVAAPLDPLIVLLGEHRADKPDETPAEDSGVSPTWPAEA
jgi:hypothetical protein